MTLRTSLGFASGWEWVGPTRRRIVLPYPEMQLFSEETRFSENSTLRCASSGFSVPSTHSLGNPFFGGLNLFFDGFRGGSSNVMHPPPGALPTRSCGFFCQATSTGGGAHHLTLLGRAVPPILLFLEGKGKGSYAYGSMANS